MDAEAGSEGQVEACIARKSPNFCHLHWRERKFNRRFLCLANHYLFELACTPASGWERGQVENQVGSVRE